MEAGKPIWSESLMTDAEIKHYSKIYNTYCTTCPKLGDFDKSEFRWRYGMGKGLSAQEIRLINSRLDELFKMVKEKNLKELISIL